ncbi:MAG: ankyrin repeat domain-containing protein [Treponema sp.]|nr:ankyrin repeat domain-containing protein [Treponema sp.]
MFFHHKYEKSTLLNASLILLVAVLLVQPAFVCARQKFDEFDYNNFISKATKRELFDEIRENPSIKKQKIPPLNENMLLCGIRNDLPLENIELILSAGQNVKFTNANKQDSLMYLALYSEDNRKIMRPILLQYGNKSNLKHALKRRDSYKKDALDYLIEKRNIPLYDELYFLLGEKPIKRCKDALFGVNSTYVPTPVEEDDETSEREIIVPDVTETTKKVEEVKLEEVIEEETPDSDGLEKLKEVDESEVPPLTFDSLDVESEKSKPIYLYDYMPKQEQFVPERTDPNRIALANIENPNSRDSNGRTMLMNAAKNGSEWEVRSLLNSGADVSLCDYEGWNALMFAIRYQNNLNIVNVLLENGADIYASNNYGANSFQLAALYSSNPEILKTILNQYTAGSNEIFRAFILTLTSNNTSSAVQEAKLQVFINRNVPLNRFFEGKTPLMYAAEFSDSTSILKLLLDAGAISTMRDANGKTAFDYASQNVKLAHDDVFWSLNSN